MSTQQGYFEHYRSGRGVPVCKKITARPVIDRLVPTRRGTRYKGSGFCLGATVQGIGRDRHTHERKHIAGQLWAGCDYGAGWWWIVTDDGAAYFAHEDHLQIVGHAQLLDEPLFGESA